MFTDFLELSAFTYVPLPLGILPTIFPTSKSKITFMVMLLLQWQWRMLVGQV